MNAHLVMVSGLNLFFYANELNIHSIWPKVCGHTKHPISKPVIKMIDLFHFCCRDSLHSPGKAFHLILEFSRRKFVSIQAPECKGLGTNVCHEGLPKLTFQVFSKMFSGFEVRALCRTLRFFDSNNCIPVIREFAVHRSRPFSFNKGNFLYNRKRRQSRPLCLWKHFKKQHSRC